MIQSIYKAVISNGFTSKGQDLKNNKRLGIKKSFTDSVGRYIEVYKETYGFSVLLYGKEFSQSYLPYRIDIMNKKDSEELYKFINKSIT